MARDMSRLLRWGYRLPQLPQLRPAGPWEIPEALP